MGENYTDMFFYTRQQEEIYDPSKYRHLIDKLVALKFYVAWGEQINQKMLTAPAISPRVQQALRETQGTTYAPWHLQAYSLNPAEPFGGFSFEIGSGRIDEEDESHGSIYLNYLYRHFDESTNQSGMYEQFLQALQAFYDAYHPIYGYQLDPRDDRDLTTLEDVEVLNIHTLYEINFFGPEVVEKLGRERIESAPAERIASLNDGGIMLLPEVYFSSQASLYSPRKVAEHLMLSVPDDSY